MPVSIDINVSSMTSSLIKGDVVLNVPTKDTEENPAYLLKLRLMGRIKTKATHDERVGTAGGSHRRRSRTETVAAIEKKEILGQDMELASFDGTVAPGTHTFAFSSPLPPDLPPSTEEIGKNGGMCSIRYSLKARLYRSRTASDGVSSDMSDPRTTRHIKIWGKPRSEARSAESVLVGPETQAVRTCCSKAGSVSIGYRVDSLRVGTGETIGLDVAARNDSSSTVTAMHIKIQQLTNWGAHGHGDHKKRTLSSILVRDSSLGALQWPAEAGTRRGQSIASVAEAAREDLRRQIAAGTGTRYELFVPRDALLTVQAGPIEVKHFLVVELQIKGASSPPDISTPLQVQRPPVSGSGAQAMSGSLLSPLPEAVP